MNTILLVRCLLRGVAAVYRQALPGHVRGVAGGQENDGTGDLFRLAEATNKPEEAKAWREERARIAVPPNPGPASTSKPEAGKP